MYINYKILSCLASILLWKVDMWTPTLEFCGCVYVYVCSLIHKCKLRK